jgi:hypothetical protein
VIPYENPVGIPEPSKYAVHVDQKVRLVVNNEKNKKET